MPKKIKAVQTDSKVIQARQNLRSAYMQVDDKKFKDENLNNKISVNQQPFIGIITLWVLPQNIIEG